MAARAPADHGLTTLGLLMQLAGGVIGGLGLAIALVALGADPGGRGAWLALVAGASVARALAHRLAGARLVYGARALRGVHAYLAIALAHTALVIGVAAGPLHVAPGALVAIAAALLVWPAALAVIVTRPAIRALRGRLPVGPDRGFESAAIVMTVLATAGLAASVLVIGFLLGQPPERPHLLWLLALAVATGGVIRSALQLQAGLDGLHETSLPALLGPALRYASFGALSALGIGAALILWTTIVQLDLAGLGLALGGLWILLAWPLILRRFFRDRQGVAGPHQRAPDAGLTGLGWLLLGSAAVAASWLALERGLAIDPALARALGVPSPLAAPAAAYLAVTALAAWAGLELVCVTRRARVVAVAWAVAAGGLAVHLVAPELLAAAAHPALYGHFADLAWLAGQFVLAAVTIRLATQHVGATARARYAATRSTIAA